jgi:hypothetical protein
MPLATEKAWAVALARDISSSIPDAVANVPGLALNTDQIASLRVAYEVRLIQTMGEDSDETPRSAATRNADNGQ